MLPGHGVPFKGKARISAFQDYLRDFIAQAKALKAQGLTAEQAAKKIDLTKHSKEFPQIREVGVDEAATRRFYRRGSGAERRSDAVTSRRDWVEVAVATTDAETV